MVLLLLLLGVCGSTMNTALALLLVLVVWVQKVYIHSPPVVVRTCNVILAFNALLLEGHLEPNCHFAFFNVP
jgi:hypothetical protein